MSNETPAFQKHGPGLDQSLLLVLSAPSGTGKTTLARRLVTDTPNSTFSISCTTRAPRGAEQEGVDYQYLTAERFREMLQADAFAEWANVYGHFYGTPRATIQSAQQTGSLVVFDIDVQGGAQLKMQYPSAVTVFILPPSYDELARRLRLRKTDTEEQIQRRLLGAESEIRKAATYDYLLVNDEVERTLKDLKAVVRAERLRATRFDVTTLGF
jgi:guanylate kinase